MMFYVRPKKGNTGNWAVAHDIFTDLCGIIPILVTARFLYYPDPSSPFNVFGLKDFYEIPLQDLCIYSQWKYAFPF